LPEPALTPELALSYLDELSTDIRAAVVLDEAGAPLAHKAAGEGSRDRLGALALDLFERADRAAGEHVPQLEVFTGDGAVYGVRQGGWTLVVVTGRFALPSVMFYDLRSVLSDLGRRAA
jgi:predicted regulator of Ras-like GTPase activity (Roadblock/LC7/MglB family)